MAKLYSVSSGIRLSGLSDPAVAVKGHVAIALQTLESEADGPIDWTTLRITVAPEENFEDSTWVRATIETKEDN